MHIRRIESLEEWERIASSWSCLTRGVAFRSWQWLSSWRRNFDHGDLFLLVVEEDGTVVGAAPLFREACGPRGKVLRFLGSGVVCSDYLSLLSTPEHENAVAAAVAQWLTDAAQSVGTNGQDVRWDLLELTGVAAEDRAVSTLCEHLCAQGNAVHRGEGVNCWRIELPSTWEEYLSQLSKSHRKQVRRAEKRVLESGKAVLHTAKTPEELAQSMEVLEDLHQRRRISLGEPGLFADERFSRFLHEAAQRLFALQQIRLHWLELNGRAAAAEFHMCSRDVVYAYQAGLDPEMLDDEPGRLINIAVLKRAVDEGFRAFDFLRGDEPYKAHWRANPVKCSEYRVVPRKAAARLRHGVWAAGGAIKQWVKTSALLSAKQPAANVQH